jgi:hypothetical protein
MKWVLYFVGRQVIVKEEFEVTSDVDVEVMHLGHFWTIGESRPCEYVDPQYVRKIILCRLTVRPWPLSFFF